MFFQKILLIISVSILSSCALVDFDRDSAKLSLFNSVGNKKAFSFVVSESFIEDNSNSKPSTLFPKMSVAELKLLMRLLEENRYCINKSDELSFKVNSKQEKVYDMTFSNLIEQSYNARPILPVTYFGECI